MKTKFFCKLITLITIVSFNSFSQSNVKEIQKIDSLITANLDVSKIDDIGRNKSSEDQTRGYNPCYDDFDSIILLFKSLKENYVSCCNGNTNYPAVARISSSIYSIMNNPNCKWGARQWLIFGYYVNDYSNFVGKNNCCK